MELGSQEARPRLERFRELGGRVPEDVGGRRMLAVLLDSGSFLPEILLSDVTQWEALRADPWLAEGKPAPVLSGEVVAAAAGATSLAELQRALRRVRRRELLRLGARELLFDATLEVAGELSALAEGCLDAALAFSSREMQRRHGRPVGEDRAASAVVLAMGKLGGGELNFSSDIDVVYFYATDAGAAGGATLHEHYTRLFELVTRVIEEPTADGFLFRVDLRLRPEGRSGALCNSLAAAERYYETFGRTWERQALLRARAVAGDLPLGRELLGVLEPFIHPRSVDPRMVDDVRALRRQQRAGAGRDGGFDVKLGAGGIRDVELVVQTLQLLHAGKRRDLRERHTPRALQRLALAGLLTDREARTLLSTYRFWRRVEHRLQLAHGAQTHGVPADDGERGRLARRLGFPDLPSFDREVSRRRSQVDEIAATFDEPAGGPPPAVLRALDPGRERPEVEADLAALGFREPAAAADAIELSRGRLLPAFVEEAAASPDPDRALARFRDLALAGSAGLGALLRDEPHLLRMLATLFGASDHLSRLLCAHPRYWDPFLAGMGEPSRSAALLRAELARRLRGLDEEDSLREAQRFHAEEILRIGFHDVAGAIDPGAVSRQLADLAEVCVDRAVEIAAAAVTRRFGRPGARLTVLALGSLGAREIRYGSDLDLVFLYDREGASDQGVDHQEWYARLAQRSIGLLGALTEEGRLYTVDTRLRPSGEQGLLVASQEAFERYHREHAAGWERVALSRARPLGAAPEAVARLLEDIVYRRPNDLRSLAREMAGLRARVERERGRAAPGARHLRFDPGGLLDVELLAAIGQIDLGRDDPALRTTSPAVALARLAERGWLPAPSGAALCSDAWFLRRVALRLRLLGDRPADALGTGDLDPLARSLGMAGGALAAELDARMARIRNAYDSCLSAAIGRAG